MKGQTDLKLETGPRLKLSGLEGRDGIREIKVVHTNPKIATVNGVKRFNNFQNSTTGSFDRSELFASSGSESGASSSSGGQVLQKSFKGQILLNNSANKQAAKLVNS